MGTPKSNQQIVSMEESNKLIVEFMGYKECPQKLFRMGDEFQSVTIYSEYQDEDEYLTIEAGKRQLKYTPEEMEYHTSWDWLMTVVEKIYQLDSNANFFGSINLEATYKEVVEFIKDYNNKI
tara:strand:- start:2329 stop:2694 length:366 start_codon:yes stop_codon:yes gene_type:complete